jgi:hypothetical protein
VATPEVRKYPVVAVLQTNLVVSPDERHAVPDCPAAQLGWGVHALATPEVRKYPVVAVLQTNLVVSPDERHVVPEPGEAQPVCAVQGAQPAPAPTFGQPVSVYAVCTAPHTIAVAPAP